MATSDPIPNITNGTPNNTHDGNKPIVGIIYPPPHIREMVNKAALYLANKDAELEDRIREKAKHNPKFCFMNPNDPYHAYYQFKLAEAREGKLQPEGEDQDNAQNGQQVVNEPKTPKQPEPFEFLATMPPVSAQDLDIMKLTAQFAARNGRQFLNQLAQRESRNYQFDFLRPSHSLFPYFTELINQYTKVLAPPKDIKERLKRNAEGRYKLLDKVKEHVEWVKWQEAEKKKKEDEEEKERIAYASIDWHEFVVVEVVEFTEADEQIDLPPPMSLSELENMSLAQKRMAAAIIPSVEEEKPGDMEMDIDDVDMEEESEEEQPPPQNTGTLEIKLPDANAPIKIRTDYKPKIIGVTPQKVTEPTQICPRCGEAIPVSEMDEHMRIELLDPKWKEQKLAAEAKKKDSNLLQEGTDVAKILKNFSGYRSDIFGTEETGIGQKIKESVEEAKRKEKAAWDGHTSSISLVTNRAAAQNTSIDEQIEAIHKSKGLTNDTFGPRLPGMEPPAAYAAQPAPPSNSQSFYSAPPQAGIPMQDPSAAFNNQLPNMYNAPPPHMQPPMYGGVGGPMDNGIRKAEQDPEGQLDAKRPRFDNGTQPPEGEWAPTEITLSLRIQTPNLPEKPEWNLNGEVIVISDLPLSTLISTVKDRISSQLGMPAGKQKLSTEANAVLNNSKSLQSYGIVDGTTLILGLKERGRK